MFLDVVQCQVVALHLVRFPIDAGNHGDIIALFQAQLRDMVPLGIAFIVNKLAAVAHHRFVFPKFNVLVPHVVCQIMLWPLLRPVFSSYPVDLLRCHHNTHMSAFDDLLNLSKTLKSNNGEK